MPEEKPSPSAARRRRSGRRERREGWSVVEDMAARVGVDLPYH